MKQEDCGSLGVSAADIVERPKNTALLARFTHFCEANPHLRFWQALSAWSGRVIVASGDDTYFWEGQFGPDEDGR